MNDPRRRVLPFRIRLGQRIVQGSSAIFENMRHAVPLLSRLTEAMGHERAYKREIAQGNGPQSGHDYNVCRTAAR